MEPQRFALKARQLLAVELGIEEIGFRFAENTIRFVADFEWHHPSGASVVLRFKPEKKVGDVRALWSLVGINALHYEYDERLFMIEFEDGSIVKCTRTHDYVHVMFFGGEVEGGMEYFEYPEIIGLIESA